MKIYKRLLSFFLAALIVLGFVTCSSAQAALSPSNPKSTLASRSRIDSGHTRHDSEFEN